MKKEANNKMVGRAIRFFEWVCRMVAVFFCAISFVMLLAAFDKDRLANERLLQQTDVVLGLLVQSVLVLAAGFNFLVGVILLVAGDPVIKALLLFWWTSICLAYRLGVGWLGHAKPGAVVALMAQKVGIAPQNTGDFLGVFFIGCIFIGTAMLIIERQRVKEFHKIKFMERYQKFRERGIPLSK